MKRIGHLNRWDGGISGSKKIGPPNSFAYERSFDFRSEPTELTVLPQPVKISGTIVTDLPMDPEIVYNDLYFYGNAGRIYTVDIDDAVTQIYTVPNSQGNGLGFFPEDKRLYFANSNSLGYYGPLRNDYKLIERWNSSFSSVWNDFSFGQAVVADGVLSVTTLTTARFMGAELAAPQDLTAYSITNQVVSTGTLSITDYEVHPIFATDSIDDRNQYLWSIESTDKLRAYKRVLGVKTQLASTTYNSAVHKFFRLREASGSIYFDYSTDGTNWTNFTSEVLSIGVTSVYIGQSVGTITNQASTSTAVFDNFSFVPFDTGAKFVNNFLETEGGAPTNTNSLRLVAASSQSATHVDDTSLSLLADLTIETYLKPTSLPTGTNKMSIVSKWDESGALRSYKLDFVPTSASFGDGSDGTLTVSSNQTETVIDANCSGSMDSNVLQLTNVTGTFAVGQRIFIHQTRGTNAGLMQENEIIGVSGTTLTLADNLTFAPLHSSVATDANKAQVRVMKQYSNVTVNNGITWTAKAWDGFKGGILAFLANGTVTVTGTINAVGKGFRGGAAYNIVGDGPIQGYQGEGYNGTGTGGALEPGTGTLPNTSGGGGGWAASGASGASGSGIGGTGSVNDNISTSGSIGTDASLSTIYLGGGGGGGSSSRNTSAGQAGGSGGGIIYIGCSTLTVTGTVTAAGAQSGISSVFSNRSGGGGGAGSILLKLQTAAIGTERISALGGALAINTSLSGYAGPAGANGFVHADYFTSVTGTTLPTLDSTQDDNLGVANGYALRLYISNDGTNFETYTQAIDDPRGFFRRFAVTWDASASTARFYENANPIGVRTGSMTAIHNNATEFAIGTSKNGSGTRSSFLDALVDDARVFNLIRSQSQLSIYNDRVLTGDEDGLVAYYKFDGNLEDSQTAGLNDLTGNNTPTYATEVGFKGVTTRNDEDVFIDTAGQTYTLTTSLNEGVTHRQTFIPTKEPLKSLAFNISDTGTGNMTAVIHDALNNEIARVTVAQADLQTGVYEFILNDSVRPILNASYHVHLFDTTGDGKIVTGTASDMETAYLKTFFQILVDDEYHPMKQFLNFMVIGNERYVAVLEAGNLYQPHRLTLPSGYRVRCLGFWNEFIAIGTWRGTSVTDTDLGKVFFWDGTSERYIEPLDVPQGAINALFGAQGTLTIVAGYKGKVLEYTGGAKAQTKFEIPEQVKTDYVEIAPNAITMWNSIVRLGATLNTNSTTVHQGIYSWGQKNDASPMSLGFDGPLSIGDQQSANTKVGCLIPRGQKLYSGFSNGNSFGLDVTDVDASPYPTATIELLNTDLGTVSGYKLPLVFKVSHIPLEAGQSVSIKYKPNRATDWSVLTTQETEGADETRAIINQRVREVAFAYDVVNGPTIIDNSLESEGEETSRQI